MNNIHSLYCPTCAGVFESLLIILPDHKMPDETPCAGSNRLAVLEISPCPRNGDHAEGLKETCPYCQGMIRRPLRYILEAYDNGWHPVPVEFVKPFINPDSWNEAIAAMCGGEIVTAGRGMFRGRLLLPTER